MKVILKEDIKGVGKKDQLLDVSDGYARNFLLPKGKAIEANAKNVSELNGKNNAKAYKKDQDKQKAIQTKEQIEKITLKVKVKAGESGKIFGGVSSKEISELLKKDFNIEVDKKKIDLKNPIKQLGQTDVDIKLFEGVKASLKLDIVKE